MRATLVLVLAVALVGLGFALAAPPASALCAIGDDARCILHPACPTWGCGPCDPDHCCGPECAPP